MRLPAATVLSALSVALALSSASVHAQRLPPDATINANEWVRGLPLTSREDTRSDNGRKKQRWKIQGVENARFEAIGTPTDADLVAWNCAEFDGQGAFLTPLRDKSSCRRFLVKVLSRFIPDPDTVAHDLLSRAAQRSTASATRLFGDLLVETDGEFFFVRRKSRM